MQMESQMGIEECESNQERSGPGRCRAVCLRQVPGWRARPGRNEGYGNGAVWRYKAGTQRPAPPLTPEHQGACRLSRTVRAHASMTPAGKPPPLKGLRAVEGVCDGGCPLP